MSLPQARRVFDGKFLTRLALATLAVPWIMETMALRDEFHYRTDSLDRVERLLAIEDVLIERIRNDRSLSSTQQAEPIQEVESRAEIGDFPEGDDWDDGDIFAILVRNPRPKGPLGKLGAAVRPESEPTDTPESKAPKVDDPSTRSRGAAL